MSEKKEYVLPEGVMYMTDEELEIMRQNFFNKYPDCPCAEVVECLELDTDPQWFEEIKSGKRKATYFLQGSESFYFMADPICHEYIQKMDKKRDEYFGNWSPLFCTGNKIIKSIKFFCGDESVIVFIKEQGWEFAYRTDIEVQMKEKYGCPELYDYIEDNYSPEGWERRRAFGESDDSIFADEDPEFHYFIFELAEDDAMLDDLTENEIDEQYAEDRKAFYEKYPDCPEPAEIECLDLIMKKEYAEMILNGTKTVEYRDVTPAYEKRLVDMKVYEYIDKKIDEDDFDFMENYDMYVTPIKSVKTIHFHNYNNSWYLDVEVIANNIVTADREGAAVMEEQFGCTELLEDAIRAESSGEEAPEYFFFGLGNIISTNLK